MLYTLFCSRPLSKFIAILVVLSLAGIKEGTNPFKEAGASDIASVEPYCNSEEDASLISSLEDENNCTDFEYPFTDVPDTYFAHDYIKTLYDLGVIEGNDKGEFAPNNTLTRAEVTKIALLTFFTVELSETDEGLYNDLEEGAWYLSTVASATRFGIVEGFDDGSFRPNAPVNRAEALKIILKAAAVSLDEENSTLSFEDVPTESWYYNYILFAVNHGIVQGRSSTHFAPEDYVTRGEMAKIAVLTSELN